MAHSFTTRCTSDLGIVKGKTQRTVLGDAFVERGSQTFFHVTASAKAGKRSGTRLPRKRVGVRQYMPVEGAQLVVLLAQRQCSLCHLLGQFELAQLHCPHSQTESAIQQGGKRQHQHRDRKSTRLNSSH